MCTFIFGALFDREEKVLSEVAESVSLPQNSSRRSMQLTTEIERRGWEDESILKKERQNRILDSARMNA